jgi:hypothetical protein
VLFFRIGQVVKFQAFDKFVAIVFKGDGIDMESVQHQSLSLFAAPQFAEMLKKFDPDRVDHKGLPALGIEHHSCFAESDMGFDPDFHWRSSWKIRKTRVGMLSGFVCPVYPAAANLLRLLLLPDGNRPKQAIYR